MCLAIELILTALLCWRFHKAGKSWLWGLVPLAALLAMGFLIGISLGIAGVTTVTASQFLWLDAIGIVVMTVMAIMIKPAK